MANKVTPKDLAQRLGLSASTMDQFSRGEVVTKESDATTDKDLSLIVAAILNSSMDGIWEFAQAERVHEIQDAMLATGVMDPSNPRASLEAMELSEDTVKTLMNNPFLSKDEAKRVKEGLKHSMGADVYKQVLAERAEAFWNKGLAGIVPYDGKGRDPAVDLKAADEEALRLVLDPTMRQEIQVVPSKSTHLDKHSLAWGMQQGNDIAAPILMHRIRSRSELGMMSVSRMFYSGADKDSSQILVGVIPTSDDGKAALFYVNHTYTAAVAGFGGSAKRSIGRKIMKGKLVDTMTKLQALKL